METWHWVVIGLSQLYWAACRFFLPYRCFIKFKHAGTRDVNTTVLVLPGFNNPAWVVAEALAEKQPSLHYVAVEMPTKWRDSKRLIEELVKFGNLNRSKTWRIYGGSMGGRLAAELLAADETPFTPKNTRLFMDSTPASIDTLKMPKLVIKLCQYWHGGPVSRPFYAIGVMAIRLLQPWPTNTPDGNPRLIRQLHLKLHFPSTVSMTSQAAYLGKFDARVFANRGLHKYEVTYIRGRDHDSLVDVNLALDEWKSIFPNLRTYHDEARRPGEHACATERPTNVAELLAAK